MKKTRYDAQHSRRCRVNLRKVLCFGLVLVMAATMLPASTPAALAQGPGEEVSITEAAAPAGEMPADLEETMPADEPPTGSIAEPDIAFAEMQNLSSTAPVELQDEPEAASIEPQNESDTASAEPNTAPAELQDEPSTETAEPQDEPDTAAAEAQNEPEEDTDKQEDTVYANSISGTLWLDVFENKGSGAYNGDGIRQPEEEPFADYEVSLYLADDKVSPVDTVTTDSEGAYIFENLEPGTYVVGLSSCTKDGVEYLLPIVGINDDTQFFSDYNEDYTTVYSKPIVIDADTAVTDIDVGMRTPMGVQPASASFTGHTENSVWIDGTAPKREIYVPGWGVWAGQSYYLDQVKVTCNGNTTIIPLKGDPYVWGDPTIIDSFHHQITGLSSGTYYNVHLEFRYRYGASTYKYEEEDHGFTTLSPPPPTITSFYVHASTPRDAQLRGTYSSAAPITKWELYIAEAGSAYSGPCTTVVAIDAFGADTFETNHLSGFYGALKPDTVYYARLYATNSGGKSNDFTFNFRTPQGPSEIPGKIVTLKGHSKTAIATEVRVNNNGALSTNKSRAEYSTNDYATWTQSTGVGQDNVTGECNYWWEFKSLTPNTKYHIRYYINTANGATYTAPQLFYTKPEIKSASSVAKGSKNALVSAVFTQGLNGVKPTKVEILYNTSNTTAGAQIVTLSSPASYATGFTNYEIEGLSPETTYYVWVRVTNPSNATDILSAGNFKTPKFRPPIAANEPTLKGASTTQIATEVVINNNGFLPTKAWVEYSVGSDSGPWVKSTGVGSQNLTGECIYWWEFGGLDPNTCYYIRYYVHTSEDEAYTPAKGFTTKPDFVSWQATPDNTDSTKATVSGDYYVGEAITAATITYGLNSDLSGGTTIPLSKGTDFTDTGFDYDLTGLIPGKTYYVQTSVTNVTGTTTSTIKPLYMPGNRITVSNTVTGSYADKTKDFIFTLTMTDKDDVPLPGTSIPYAGGTLILDGNGQATFTLKHGESLIGWVGTTNKICIEETPVTGYTASYDLDGNGALTVDSTGFIDVNSLDHTVAFTNARGNIVPTGVNTGNMQGMYVILAGGLVAAVLAGLCILLYRSKRKRRYE